MMRTSRIAIALSFAGSAAWAQSGSSGLQGLESCFKAARLSDAICMNLSNAPAQQVDCFEKARAAQLECLQHVPSGSSAAAPEKPTANPPDRSAANTRERPAANMPERPAVDTLERPAGKEAAQEPRAPAQPEPPRAMPRSTTAAAPTITPPDSVVSPQPLPPEKSAARSPLEDATGIVSPKPPSAVVRRDTPSIVPRDQPAPGLPKRSAGAPDLPARSNWVVSETTSPIDYSPLVTAQLPARRNEKGAPDSLIIRCRQSRLELLLRIAGGARANSDIQISYQLNDQPSIKQRWLTSADGRMASYPEDAAALLRSLPEGARLTVDLFDGSGPGRDAIFQLTGFDTVRQKVQTACKSLSGSVSSERR
jgi:hypothetical protein